MMMDTFDKYELEIIERALTRLTDGMSSSKFIDKEDKHLLKCEALRAKVQGLVHTPRKLRQTTGVEESLEDARAGDALRDPDCAQFDTEGG
jgi:hypothetical protein